MVIGDDCIEVGFHNITITQCQLQLHLLFDDRSIRKKGVTERGGGGGGGGGSRFTNQIHGCETLDVLIAVNCKSVTYTAVVKL